MPKLSSFRITKKAVDNLPSDRDAVYFDAELRGFAVRTKPSGAKSYLVQYKMDGRTRRITLGSHGQLTPTQAREQAAITLGRIKAGENPSEQRRLDRSATTVRQLSALYFRAAEQGLILGKRGSAKKTSTLSVDKGRVARHIDPLLGGRRVRDIKPTDVVRFMREIATGKTAADIRTRPRGRAIVKGGKGTASRTVGLLGGMLSFAVSEGIIDTNPVRGIQRPADGRRRIRLSADDYRRFGQALGSAAAVGEPWQAIAMMKLLALTGCRRGEIEKLKWAEVDLAAGVLRLSDTKTGTSIRPIGLAVRKLLSGLDRSADFVFPALRQGRDGKKFYGGLPKAWIRICDRGEIRDLTPHGLRHAFASSAHDLGFSDFTIAALLGHSSGNITSRYVHHIDKALIAAADDVTAFIETAMVY